MISITKRRLASLATASAIVATMAVAVVPAAALAAEPCVETGVHPRHHQRSPPRGSAGP